MRKRQSIAVLAILVLAVGLSASCAVAAQGGFSVPKDVRKIFNDSCISCHGGATPAAGHNYSTDADLEKLLGMPSSEEKSVAMIDPGNPAKSYLVMKIKGAKGIVGSRMPLAGTALSGAEIKTIEDWISGMGTKTGSAAAAAGTPGSADPPKATSAPAAPAGGASKPTGQDPPKQMASPTAKPGDMKMPAAGAKPMSMPMAADMFDGAFVYEQKCSNCHGASGEGVFLFGVPLAGNAFIETGTYETIGEVINMGRKYQDIHYPEYPGMPKFQFITGGELEALIDHLTGPIQG